MSVILTVLGTIAQLMLGMFLFMGVIFAGAGLASGGDLGKTAMSILNASIFALPGLCGVSAIIVIFLHIRGSGAAAYGWYALPIVGAAVYMAYFAKLARWF